MRWLAALLMLCLPAVTAAQEPDRILRMGVRTDVPPFIWKDSDSQHFRGFFWDICTTALARAGYVRELVELNAPQRRALLQDGGFGACDAEGNCPGEETVDLLCDPTTITLARMKVFAAPGRPVSKFRFSPILFVANGSYVQQDYPRGAFRNRLVPLLRGECGNSAALKRVICPGETARYPLGWLVPTALRKTTDAPAVDWRASCEAITNALAGELRHTPTSADPTPPWPPQIWPVVEAPKPQFEVWGYVGGATIGATVEAAARRAPGNVGICPRALGSHVAAAEAFCQGRIYRYFGDVELVRSAIEAYRAAHVRDCPVDDTPAAKGTYEPYAMVLSAGTYAEFPEDFNVALYSMFSDGTIAQFFRGRFGPERQSQYLGTLFRINSIPPGQDASGGK